MWPPGVVETVCKVIASTSYPGLTSSEIGRLLAMRGFRDVIPDGTKWRRLEAAMQTQQQHDHAANCLIRFITDAMEPSRYVDDPNRFSALRDGLTEALALVGLKINEQGKVARAQVARNLDEVAKLAGRLQTELHRRGVHDQVISYCQEELIRKSLFHAVFEATKGLAARLRTLSGSILDGSELVDYCFASKTGTPVIRINSYVSLSDKSEHSGFANQLRGVFGAFRNPPAHTPRATGDWTICEADALDYFSWLSLLHRRLDKAVVALRVPGTRSAHATSWSGHIPGTLRRDLLRNDENRRDLSRRSDRIRGAFAMVKETLAQDPAYRPTHQRRRGAKAPTPSPCLGRVTMGSSDGMVSTCFVREDNGSMGTRHGIKVATDRHGRISLAGVVARWAHLYLAEELPNGTIVLTPLPPASEKVKLSPGHSIRAVSGGAFESDRRRH